MFLEGARKFFQYLETRFFFFFNLSKNIRFREFGEKIGLKRQRYGGSVRSKATSHVYWDGGRYQELFCRVVW